MYTGVGAHRTAKQNRFKNLNRMSIGKTQIISATEQNIWHVDVTRLLNGLDVSVILSIAQIVIVVYSLWNAVHFD